MMDGILLVDKPSGWTSHDLCQYLKKRFGLKKVGHAGTLDPAATGVMILLVNGMTKLADRLINEDKAYRGVVQLGIRTTTQDLEGEVLERMPVEGIQAETIVALEKKFLGEQLQVPPMVSAKKVGGVRLYQLARRGKLVDREARKVTIFDFKVEQVNLPFFTFHVKVSKGFYVRVFAEDLGAALGTTGALAELVRTESGCYRLEDCISWDEVRQMKTRDDLRPYLKQPLHLLSQRARA